MGLNLCVLPVGVRLACNHECPLNLDPIPIRADGDSRDFMTRGCSSVLTAGVLWVVEEEKAWSQNGDLGGSKVAKIGQTEGFSSLGQKEA